MFGTCHRAALTGFWGLLPVLVGPGPASRVQVAPFGVVASCPSAAAAEAGHDPEVGGVWAGGNGVWRCGGVGGGRRGETGGVIQDSVEKNDPLPEVIGR